MLSAMRHRAAELGERCTLPAVGDLPLGSGRGDRSRWRSIQPTSWAALHLVDRLADERDVDRLPARGFSASRAEFTAWADGRGRKRLLMEDFYRDNRRRIGLLMDGAEPVGGRWNFDAENREPPPKGRRTLGLPEPVWPVEDDIDAAVREDLDRLAAEGVDVPRRRRSAAVRGHPRGSSGGAGRLRRAPAAGLRPVRGRDHVRRPLDGPLAAVGAAEPGAAGADRGGSGGRAGVPRRGRTAGRGRGLRPSGDRLARLHLAPLLAPGRGLPDAQPAEPAALHRRLVRRLGSHRDRRRLRTVGPHVGPGDRLDPPHPAADGARQLRPAAPLEAATGDRLVPPGLRRRLRLGDGAERGGHEPARRRRRSWPPSRTRPAGRTSTR